MTGSGNRIAVLIIFPACAAATLALSTLKTLIRPQTVQVDFLAFSTIAEGLITNPSVFFTIGILLAGYIAVSFQLLPTRLNFSLRRIASGAGISVIAYPFAMVAMMSIGIFLMGPSDSDNPNPLPVPVWRQLVSESAPAVALLVGGLITVYWMALAFRVATGRKPRKVWMWAIAIALGAPLLTIVLGYASIFLGATHDVRTFNILSPLDLILLPMPLRAPLLLWIGEILLALAIANWLFSAAAKEPTGE